MGRLPAPTPPPEPGRQAPGAARRTHRATLFRAKAGLLLGDAGADGVRTARAGPGQTRSSSLAPRLGGGYRPARTRSRMALVQSRAASQALTMADRRSPMRARHGIALLSLVVLLAAQGAT